MRSRSLSVDVLQMTKSVEDFMQKWFLPGDCAAISINHTSRVCECRGGLYVRRWAPFDWQNEWCGLHNTPWASAFTLVESSVKALTGFLL